MIRAIVAIKQRHPPFGCPRIALTMFNSFGIRIDKDGVRRVLAKHYRPDHNTGGGPSWLSFIGDMKDSLIIGKNRFGLHEISLRSPVNRLHSTFFDYPPEIRRAIYVTNAIEPVNMSMSLRKITKNRGSFPSDEAILKLLYL